MNATPVKVGMRILIAAVVVAVLVALGFHYFILPAKRFARWTYCKSCLSTLGGSCRQYGREHNGNCPTSWCDIAESLTQVDPLGLRLFRCTYNSEAPGSLTNVDEWADFILVPGVTLQDPPDTILAYEPAGNHRREGASVLFVNGAVYRITLERFQTLKTKDGNPLKKKMKGST